MELQQLRYFKAIAEAKSISKAADVLFMTQPALSISLKKLEEELGVKLFMRDGKELNLTKAGEEVLICADKMLTVEKELETDLSKYKDEDYYDTLRIAATEPSTLGGFLSEYFLYNPSILFNSYIRKSDSFCEDLIKKRLDLCLTFEPIMHKDIHPLPCMEMRFYVVAPKDYAFHLNGVAQSPRKKTITLDMLNGETFITKNANPLMIEYLADLQKKKYDVKVLNIEGGFIFNEMLASDQYLLLSNNIILNRDEFKKQFTKKSFYLINDPSARYTVYFNSLINTDNEKVIEIKNWLRENYSHLMNISI